MKLRVEECEHILAQIMTIYILFLFFQKRPVNVTLIRYYE
jgi:hypothetical protein